MFANSQFQLWQRTFPPYLSPMWPFMLNQNASAFSALQAWSAMDRNAFISPVQATKKFSGENRLHSGIPAALNYALKDTKRSTLAAKSPEKRSKFSFADLPRNFEDDSSSKESSRGKPRFYRMLNDTFVQLGFAFYHPFNLIVSQRTRISHKSKKIFLETFCQFEKSVFFKNRSF
jgi:hypothetical protein